MKIMCVKQKMSQTEADRHMKTEVLQHPTGDTY